VFENRVLRTIFEPKRDEVTGGWRKLDEVKEDEMGRACSTHGDMLDAYRMLVGKPDGRKPLWRRRHRREDNIKIYLGDMGWGGMDWIDLAQDRDQLMALADTVMNLRVPYDVGIFLSS
jgi:hypothetical protein